MPPSNQHRTEVQVSKSPAEFFAENQAIAGFDNLGKSLYTTLRELMENSLDACESVQVLPDISVYIEEMTQEEFNVVRGLTKKGKGHSRKDLGLFEKKKTKGSKAKEDVASSTTTPSAANESKTAKDAEKKSDNQSTTSKASNKKNTKQTSKSAEGYFRIKVKDNGCGMAHDSIPNLLGRVLSGSKYGVRQTRGKFGLGAKMALIWSKKSTGVPIHITTAHTTQPNKIPTHVSTCVLDIDIYKNCPRVIEHKKRPNKENYIGTEFQVLICGNWTTYKSRVNQYLQQLAIITPYAQLELHYTNQADSKKNFTIRYDRRSEQMPPPALTVKHHPSSVNNLLVSQLLHQTKTKNFHKFLCTELAGVSPALAKRLVTELEQFGFEESMGPEELTDKQVTRLVQLLRSVELFKMPDGSCLSPLGEYNLNLGIRKVLEPDVVATARDKPTAYEGHPVIVEAAVSLGGKNVKEGITVVRFANRIPLLFEAGADVATRVANNKIKWSSYKIDMKKDKIGVFVSIVSTKVPFKGTGKEYIGDDITEIQLSVKRALQNCCQQLRAHLTKKHAMKDIKERKSRLVKYVPDIGRSLFGLLDGMRKRRLEQGSQHGYTPLASPAKSKRIKLDDGEARDMIRMLDRKEVTEETIKQKMMESIEAQAESTEGAASGAASGRKGKHHTGVEPLPLVLARLDNLQSSEHDIRHPLFTFRPIQPIIKVKKNAKGKGS